jgi:Flp pilus assembly protein protease CpaA
MGLLSYLILVIFALVISAQDIKEHKIKNRKLIFYSCLLIIISIISHSFAKQMYSGIFFLIFSLVVFLLARRRADGGIGFGDVKLSFVIGLSFSDIHLLLVALNASWIMGGLWALLSRHSKIAFAPWMLTGAVITQILIK